MYGRTLGSKAWMIIATNAPDMVMIVISTMTENGFPDVRNARTIQMWTGRKNEENFLLFDWWM